MGGASFAAIHYVADGRESKYKCKAAFLSDGGGGGGVTFWGRGESGGFGEDEGVCVRGQTTHSTLS